MVEPICLLNEIETLWSTIFQAHGDEPQAAHAAQARLMLRYVRAVHRYLLAITRDPELADDLTQEFALRVLRGSFKNADPSRGRFRDLVRAAARNLVYDHHRRTRKHAQSLSAEVAEPADPHDADDPDEPFLRTWRNELHDRAWAALAAHQQRNGQPFYDVLRLRLDSPDLTSAQMAEELTQKFGRPIKDGWVRQVLLRARQTYVDLLLDEVAASLHNPSAEQLEEELIVLGLLEYCRDGLHRRATPASRN
jgi:RNA polymerase sigma-70 factor (ECF subfamily)